MLTNPSFSNLTCEICFELFDLEIRIPKSLSCCGKSVCRKCLSIIQQERTYQCPWCKSRGNLSSENCKTNIQLLNIIEEDSKWEKCPHHQENMKLVCKQDKHKVCSYCGYTSECKNHELVHLMNLKPTSDQRLKELQGDYNSIENKMEKYDKIISENRNIFQGTICDSFDKQIHELQKAKAKTLMKLHSSLNTRRNTMVDTFGEKSSLRTEMQVRIYNHMNFLKAKDPLSVIEEDLSILKGRVSSLLGGDQDVALFEQQLSQMAPLLKEQLENSFTKNTKSDFDELITGIPNYEADSKEECGDIQVGELQVHVSGLSIEFSETTTTGKKILSCKQESDRAITIIKLNFEQNKQVQGVSIDLRNLDLNEANLRALEYSFAQISKLSQVTIISELTPNLHKLDKLSNLFAILFKKPQDIEDLNISLISNNDLALLLNIILPQMSSLEILTINSVALDISLQNFENFTENLQVVAPRLKDLKINISGTSFPASSLKKLFISMPKIENIHFNFSKINSFDDEVLSVLSDNIQSLLPVVRKLVLNLSQTKVSSSGTSTLKNNISHIPMTLILPEEGGQGMSLAALLGLRPGEARVSMSPHPMLLQDLVILGDTVTLLERLRGRVNRPERTTERPEPQSSSRPQIDDIDMFFDP